MELDLKWAYGKFQGSPTFLSSDDILIPCDFFLKICNSTGSNFRVRKLPLIHIGCATVLSELGVLAVSEANAKPNIHIFSFSKLEKISLLKQINDLNYKLLKFTGLEFLVSFGLGILDSKIDVWNWYSGELLQSVSLLLPSSNSIPIFLTVNPLSWYLLTLQMGNKLYHLEVKVRENSFHVEADEICFDQDDHGNFNLRREEAKVERSEEQNKGVSFDLSCHCWILDGCVLFGTPLGIFKSSIFPDETNYLDKKFQDDQLVTSMVLTPSGLFLGSEKNVKLLDISHEVWIVLNTIEVEYAVRQLIPSPDFSVILVETDQGFGSWHQMCKKMFHLVRKLELSNIIDVYVIGPTSEYFVVACETGFINFFRFEDGYMISSIFIEEKITSFAASPLCSLVTAGTSAGFIYFISVVDIHNPIIIQCVKGHESIVDNAKFDSFGSYLFTSNQDEGINVWNASPKSNFNHLGLIKIAQVVKGVALLTDDGNGDTDVLILTEDGLSSEERSGNVLIRLSLPFDFKTSFENYYIDSFRTLNIESLFYQKWYLDYPCCNLDVQKDMGAILYSPITKQIQKFSLWTDSVSKQANLIEVDNFSYFNVSFNQRYLASITRNGGLQLFSNNSMKLVSTEDGTAPSNRYVLEFSRYGNSLLVANEACLLSRIDWRENDSNFQNIPKCLVYCQMHSEEENTQLLKRNAEKEIDRIGRRAILKSTSRENKTNYLTFGMWTDIMNYRLKKLLRADVIKDSKKLFDANFVFAEKFLNDSSDKNSSRFFKCLQREDEDIFAGSTMECNSIMVDIKVVSSTNLGYIIYNYTTIQFLPGRYLKENLRSINLKQVNVNDLSILKPLSFKITTELNNAKDTLLVLENIRKQVCHNKLNFNKTFHVLYNEARVFADKLSNVSCKIEKTNHGLPEKAERDLTIAPDNETETLDFTSNSGVSHEVEYISGTRQSMELSDSTSCWGIAFDTKVERLFLRKLFCDYIIHANELKIFCTLLLMESEYIIYSWTKEKKQQIDRSKILRGNISATVKESNKRAKCYHKLYKRIREVEQSAAINFEMKCAKFDCKAEIHRLSKYQPRCWLPSITAEYLSSSVFQVALQPPDGIDETKWQKLCTRKSRLLKLNAILRYIQLQSINITQIKIHSEEMLNQVDCSLSEGTEKISKVTEILSALKENIRLLLANNLDTDMLEYFRIAGLKLSDIPRSSHFVWEGIKTSSERNKNLQMELENLEALIDDFKKLSSDMCLEVRKQEQNHQLVLEKLQCELDENKKQLTNINDIFDHLDCVHKWNVFKTFT